MEFGFSLVHVSDLHFGGVADLYQIEALETVIPDIEPRVIVISGDISQRARHGELQRARAFVREAGRTAPVFIIPGNHDVQWWWRPFIPFGSAAKYRKYRQYFGHELAPTLEFPEAIITAANTSHGVAWGSLTPRLRDVAVKGHLPKGEIDRVRKIFREADESQTRILVMHHNLLRGELSKRMGLARWQQAQRRVVESGADIVLCGHDHQDGVDTLDGVVVACAGTLSGRSRGARAPLFYRIGFDNRGVHVEEYQWNATERMFRRADVHAFARRRVIHEEAVRSSIG
ncbi:MAG: metallophosphoesterase [Gemmatimonadetes bacterium]|nr:metallophosphoesterase [Gemmatimonadota bacterium]